MPDDPEYLREHAMRCWTLAAQTDNPLLKNSLLKVAQRNVRLAVGLEEHRQAKVVLRLITPEMLSHH